MAQQLPAWVKYKELTKQLQAYEFKDWKDSSHALSVRETADAVCRNALHDTLSGDPNTTKDLIPQSFEDRLRFAVQEEVRRLNES